MQFVLHSGEGGVLHPINSHSFIEKVMIDIRQNMRTDKKTVRFCASGKESLDVISDVLHAISIQTMSVPSVLPPQVQHHGVSYARWAPCVTIHKKPHLDDALDLKGRLYRNPDAILKELVLMRDVLQLRSFLAFSRIATRIAPTKKLARTSSLYTAAHARILTDFKNPSRLGPVSCDEAN